MSTEKKGAKKFVRKLRSKYRLVVMNDETFEEKGSVILSPLNVLIIASIASLILVGAGVVIIAFTPLREYIPGYMDISLSKKVLRTGLRLDSLERELALREKYIGNINKIITGEKKKTASDSQSDNDKGGGTANETTMTNTVESARQNIRNLALSSLFFFPPVTGFITNHYNDTMNHYGTDIATAKGEAVKSVLDGTVILTDWTPETGYVVGVQHEYKLVTIYKHNSMSLKKEGDRVKAGEVIAIAGESGELSTGPHLHFELWYNGNAVNPEDYITISTGHNISSVAP